MYSSESFHSQCDVLSVWKQNISAKIGLILSFSLILIWGGRLPVVRIGRIAGQYAKPRSSRTETFDDRKVLSFRGDNINGYNERIYLD